jgi:hypothetical protein
MNPRINGFHRSQEAMANTGVIDFGFFMTTMPVLGTSIPNIG